MGVPANQLPEFNYVLRIFALGAVKEAENKLLSTRATSQASSKSKTQLFWELAHPRVFKETDPAHLAFGVWPQNSEAD